MFVVVNFDALEQAAGFLIERREVFFLCCLGFEAGTSETPNLEQLCHQAWCDYFCTLSGLQNTLPCDINENEFELS